MEIKPINTAGSYKTGILSSDISVEKIAEILGFPPNIYDDPDKVEHSWGFTVDGVICGIWDYKGYRWSTYGPKSVFDKLFGDL